MYKARDLSGKFCREGEQALDNRETVFLSDELLEAIRSRAADNNMTVGKQIRNIVAGYAAKELAGLLPQLRVDGVWKDTAPRFQRLEGAKQRAFVFRMSFDDEVHLIRAALACGLSKSQLIRLCCLLTVS